MNDDYCVCPLKGFCERHGYNKTRREHEICQGINIATPLANQYRKAWEQGTFPGRRSDAKPSKKFARGVQGLVHKTTSNDRVPRVGKPGTELKRLLSWFGAHGSTGCGCTNHANTMDQRGCDWCDVNVETIVGWLQVEASKSKVLGFSLDMVPGFEIGAAGLVRRAIANARAKIVEAAKPVEPVELPDLETSPLDDATVQRTLLYYLFPLGGDSAWCWRRNLDQLAEYRHLFNAGTHFTIAEGKHKKQPTESIEAVTKYLQDVGFTNPVIHVRKNNKKREAAHFAGMLSAAKSLDPNAVFCVAHAKGVTHTDHASVVHRWTELMYQAVLGNWDSARIALESYGTAGAFKRYGDFKTPGNHRWHYSGTFYWVRSASVFRRDWSKVDRQFFGMESWPGLQFRASEGACLFADNVGDVYNVPVLQAIDKQLTEQGVLSIPRPDEYQETLRNWGVEK